MVISQIFYYALACVAIGLSVVSTVIAFIKGNKSKTDKSTTESGIKTISQEIISKIPEYVVMSENFYNSLVPSSMQKTGAQKLAYVLDKVKIDCLTNNVEYNEQEVTNEVEKLIDLTKQVNSK